jgi:maleamate amidohydrolase
MRSADQRQDYERAGFGGELTPGRRPAVLLVDPAKAYVEPESPLYAGAAPAVGAMKTLLWAARAHGVPVIVTQVRVRADGSDAGLFFRKVPTLTVFSETSPYAATIEGLAPEPAELLVTKHYPSAFFGTSLASYLTARGVDTVLIGGFSTSGCVRASTLDAMQHGFVPIVVEEAVGDRDREIHASNLFDIQYKMGEVWPLARAADYLEGGSAR